MSAATTQLAALTGSTVDGAVVTCFTHLMSDVLIGLGVANIVEVVSGASITIDIGGESHRLTRISDTQHTVEDLTP